jgi:type III pantothenate kinase
MGQDGRMTRAPRSPAASYSPRARSRSRSRSRSSSGIDDAPVVDDAPAVAVVDIGNARIKWARVVDGRLACPGAAIHIDALESAMAALADALPRRLTRILASNVAGPETASSLAELARRRWGVELELVETEPETLGVRCAYRDPRRLGVDRWVAVVAAHVLAKTGGGRARPACVINAGSAYTFDAVDADGRHLGGLILAGPRIAAGALERSTRRIGPTAPAKRIPAGLELLGRSTDEAVGHGALLGPAAAFDRAIRMVREALGASPVVYVAGGDGALLAGWLETEVELRADLVLEGLALIAAGRPARRPASASE